MLDDPFDIDPLEAVVPVAGSGVLDDAIPCECACGCERVAEWPESICDECRAGEHWTSESADSADWPVARDDASALPGADDSADAGPRSTDDPPDASDRHTTPEDDPGPLDDAVNAHDAFRISGPVPR